MPWFQYLQCLCGKSVGDQPLKCWLDHLGQSCEVSALLHRLSQRQDATFHTKPKATWIKCHAVLWKSFQILPAIVGGSGVRIVQCLSTFSLYCNFLTSHLTGNMWLTALRNDQSVYADVLSFPEFLLVLGGGLIPCDGEERVALSFLIPLQSDVCSVCLAIFTGIESNSCLKIGLQGSPFLQQKM